MKLEITLLQILAVLFLPGAWTQSSTSLGAVVETKNITFPVGSKAVLPCHSPRMVWTQDRLKDRQRVVHWDMVRSSPEYSVERILDMSPGGRQRVYNGFNKGRVAVPDSAFSDGNFSLVINNVVTTDRGVYTCNLHHHYCQIHQSIQIQLNVTKSVRKEKRYWDGERTVFVVLLGKSVVLPCVNRRPLWREGLQEDQQQVAHWDFQAPGVRQDRADRLVDLYASGERRDYGPVFAQSKMSVEEDAFTLGDFSLSISDLKPVDRGLYSCHLHHHYCGLYERRIFRLTVAPSPPPPPPPPPASTTPPRIFQNDVPVPRTEEVEGPRVVNVILPEHRGYFVQHLGYFLATFLLLALVVVAIIVLTRRRKKRGLDYELRRSERGTVIVGGDVSLECTELRPCTQESLNSDYKNNLLKERDMTKECNKDLDGKMWK
ncbi:matrix remodeling-associated protein 8-like [Platichthys flesus]|uniref:matrix remodeling-associated protein 8-like n=1 Tax=Platichthys flesus TaxID=8260 RepID=UPI002DBE0468|nr:matrix remodeling-associated protein 8-like [Platichthys flesus]XP_062248634.1 matrix remodeling-associated protein 8-like [Platichthys flesus]